MLVCAFLSASCTRDRGCSKHPAFPAPSHFLGETICATRANHAAGMRTCTSTSLRAKRSNPFHRTKKDGLLRFARNDVAGSPDERSDIRDHSHTVPDVA